MVYYTENNKHGRHFAIYNDIAERSAEIGLLFPEFLTRSGMI